MGGFERQAESAERCAVGGSFSSQLFAETPDGGTGLRCTLGFGGPSISSGSDDAEPLHAAPQVGMTVQEVG